MCSLLVIDHLFFTLTSFVIKHPLCHIFLESNRTTDEKRTFSNFSNSRSIQDRPIKNKSEIYLVLFALQNVFWERNFLLVIPSSFLNLFLNHMMEPVRERVRIQHLILTREKVTDKQVENISKMCSETVLLKSIRGSICFTSKSIKFSLKTVTAPQIR